MNWRKLIYSIIIPSIAGFTFGIFISIGTLTNAIVFFYGIVMMIAAFLSSTGKGKNGDAFSTVIMGALVQLDVCGKDCWIYFSSIAYHLFSKNDYGRQTTELKLT